MANSHNNCGMSFLKLVAALMCTGAVTTGTVMCIVVADSAADRHGNVAIEYVAGGSLRIENLKLNGGDVSKGADIVFGSLAGDEEGRIRWDGTGGENLTAEVSGRLINAEKLSELSFFVILPQGVIEAALAGYVDVSAYYDLGCGVPREIAVDYAPSDIVTGAEGVSWLDFSFEISLGWGERFRGDNPSIYYDKVYLDEDGAVDKDAGAYVSDAEMMETLTEFKYLLSAGEQNYRIIIRATA